MIFKIGNELKTFDYQMKNVRLLFLLSFFFNTLAVAAFSDTIYNQRIDNLTSFHEWSISYFGRTITRPGLKISLSHNILKTIHSNRFDFSIQTSAGFYYHRSNQTALFSMVDFVPLVNLGKEMKWYFSIPMGLGYMRTFLDGTQYAIDDNGIIERLHFVGGNYLMPNIGFSIGRRIHDSILSKVFMTLGAFGQYPYNSYMLPNIYFEIGIAW